MTVLIYVQFAFWSCSAKYVHHKNLFHIQKKSELVPNLFYCYFVLLFYSRQVDVNDFMLVTIFESLS